MANRNGCVERSGTPNGGSQERRMTTNDNNPQYTELTYSQVCRLHLVMYDNVVITPNARVSAYYPTIEIQMQELVKMVRRKLLELDIPLRDIRMNGGAASYVLGNDEEKAYNDFDLIYGVDLGRADGSERVKLAVLRSLLEFFPRKVNDDGVEEVKPTLNQLEEVYFNKLFKVATAADSWSLIALSNSKGFDVELKFVDRMRRQFEFSVDSFQIVLDNLLTFYVSPNPRMNRDFYPRILAESVYGSFDTALNHLNEKLISTYLTEQIRGGGLLKYCHLIARGYKPAPDLDYRLIEKYMCARFFIDFPSSDKQHKKLEAYLSAHFIANRHIPHDCTKYEFLATLYTVVEDSSNCLMGGERFQTLKLIHDLAQQALMLLGYATVGGINAACNNVRSTWRTATTRPRPRHNNHNNGGATRFPSAYDPSVFPPYPVLVNGEFIAHFVPVPNYPPPLSYYVKS